ncbi:hypothetical protein BDQ17DRAFT_1433608 [Cyathus striatus]|nr:hypothetical protein BDQ17DRAFT_1433608 [Cyathus striatus]
MTAHNAAHRRHAVSNRRRVVQDQDQSPTNVHLHPRYSPTAIYGGVTIDDSNVLTLPGVFPITLGDAQTTTSSTPVPTSTTEETQPLIIPIIPTDIQSTSTSTVIVIPSTTSTSTSVLTSSTLPPVTTTSSSSTPSTPSTTSTKLFITSSPTASEVIQTSTLFQTSTRSLSLTSSASASSTSAANDTADDSSVSTGAVVGGIAAGVVAVAAVGLAIAFFIRRSRRKRDDSGAFDPTDFRRSAMIINDPPTHEDTIARGYNPRPPTMIERRQMNSNSPAPTFGTQYGAPAPAYPDDPAMNYGMNRGDGAYPSFTPGQVMNANYGNMSPGYGPASADPLFPPSAYANQSPFSPMESPMSAVMYNERGEPVNAPVLTRQPSHGAPLARQDSYNNGYNSYGEYGNGNALNRQPSYGAPSQLSRQLSGSAGIGAGSATGAGISAAALSFYPAAVRQAFEARSVNAMPTPQAPASPPPPNGIPVPPTPSESDTSMTDYVDLTRSSVSPYQAAQYAEISRKLNAEPPKGLDSPAVEEEIMRTSAADPDRDLPPVPLKDYDESPFADPRNTMPTPRKDMAVRPVSSDSISQEISQELEFPVPPSPAAAYNSKFRIDSTPPTLPEIQIESRVSVASYNGSFGRSSPIGSAFPSGVTTIGTGGRTLFADSRFPTTPSPLASSFGMPTPPINGSFDTGASAPTPSKLSNVATVYSTPEQPKRPETVYDPDDAYGGM